ncbi:MAG: ArsR/SmtB family transcription factor [Candidatus Nanohalobium sp.]
MLSDVQKKVLNSRQSLEVLSVIKDKNESYGKEIARELGKSQSSISRTIRQLKDSKLITKGRREQAQYYKIDYEGVADLYLDILEEGKEKNEAYQEQLAKKPEYEDEDWITPELFDQFIPEAKAKKFAKAYYRELFNNISKITDYHENIDLEDFIVKSAYQSLILTRYNKEENYEVVGDMLGLLQDYLDFFDPHVATEDIIEDNFVSLEDREEIGAPD